MVDIGGGTAHVQPPQLVSSRLPQLLSSSPPHVVSGRIRCHPSCYSSIGGGRRYAALSTVYTPFAGRDTDAASGPGRARPKAYPATILQWSPRCRADGPGASGGEVLPRGGAPCGGRGGAEVHGRGPESCSASSTRSGVVAGQAPWASLFRCRHLFLRDSRGEGQPSPALATPTRLCDPPPTTHHRHHVAPVAALGIGCASRAPAKTMPGRGRIGAHSCSW